MKVGDRIKVINVNEISNKNVEHGDLGKIITFIEIKKTRKTISIGIEMDKHINGHSCDGLGRRGHCIWLTKKRIQKVGK